MHSTPLPKITRPQISPVLVSIVILFLICTGSSIRAAVIYVSGSDTYQTIQAAVNAALPGDEIIVRDGTYPENILIDKSLNIHSENGQLTTFIEAADPVINVIAVTADQVIIEGFSISGGTGLNVCGILLGHTAAGASVGNCRVSHNRIGYSDSHKNCYGIYIFGGSNNILQDNIISFNDKFGITLNQANHNHLTGNNCSDNGLTNPHSVSPTGILIYTSSDNDIDNNSCNNNNSYGIQLYDPDANNNCHNNYLTNNICRQNRLIGIYLDQADYNLLTDNQCLENGVTAIKLSSAHHNQLVKSSDGNLLADSPNGLVLYESNTNQVSGNTFSDNDFALELNSANNNHITDNLFTGNNSSSIRLFAGGGMSCSNNSLKNNDITGNSSTFYGIFLSNASSNIISDNLVTAHNTGIYLSYASNNNQIINNDFRDNRNIALYLRQADTNFITKNLCSTTITSSNKRGLLLTESSNNVITANTFSNNYYGLQLKRTTEVTSIGNRIYANRLQNNRYGFYIDSDCNQNYIYLNSLIDNSYYNAYSNEAANHWSSPEKIHYLYANDDFDKITGNYYSNHNLTDSDGDGITDALYNISGPAPLNQDVYPLAADPGIGIIFIDYDEDGDVDGLDLLKLADYQAGYGETSLVEFAENFGR